jgi:hypothetical protein
MQHFDLCMHNLRAAQSQSKPSSSQSKPSSSQFHMEISSAQPSTSTAANSLTIHPPPDENYGPSHARVLELHGLVVQLLISQ